METAIYHCSITPIPPDSLKLLRAVRVWHNGADNSSQQKCITSETIPDLSLCGMYSSMYTYVCRIVELPYSGTRDLSSLIRNGTKRRQRRTPDFCSETSGFDRPENAGLLLHAGAGLLLHSTEFLMGRDVGC